LTPFGLKIVFIYDETGDENTITSSAMKRKEFVVRNSLLERDEWSSILKTRTEIGLLERMITTS